MSVLDLYRDSARKFARDGAPHVPVATVVPNTCATCGHAIGWSAEQDPIHAVPKPCAQGCGTTVRPFITTCEPCLVALDAKREAARAERMRGYAPEPSAEATEEQREAQERGREANPAYAEAKAYAVQYGGTFDFMRSMHDRVTGPRPIRGPLSPKQVEAILKCKAADIERAARATARDEERARNQTGRDLTVLPVGRTYAAVENESGVLTFLIFDRPGEKDRYGTTNRWSGWVFVKQQQGPNEVRLGSQRPGETYSGQWPTLVDKVLADPIGAVEMYGKALGICGVCARPLTNEESREQGIGPVCRSRISI